MVNFKLLAAFSAILLILIVIIQNSQPVETKLLFISITMPNAALLASTLLIGIVVGVLVALSFSSAKRKAGGKQEKIK